MNELTDFISSISSHKIPTWDELPDLDLYMDQVIMYLERHLSIFATKDDEKIITPAMINNYVKLGIIPPPDKKKYNRNHIAYLIAICILKSVLPISNIAKLIDSHREKEELSTLLDVFCSKQSFYMSKAAEDLKSGLESNMDPALLAMELASLSCSYRLASEKVLSELIQ